MPCLLGSLFVPCYVRCSDDASVASHPVLRHVGDVFLLAPHWLPRMYPGQADVLAAAVPLLGVAAFFQLSDGVQGVGAGVLRGAGDTVFTFGANVVGHYAVGLPIALGLGFWRGQGITGIWWGLACGLTAVALSLLGRFLWLSARPIAPRASTTSLASSASSSVIRFLSSSRAG